MKSVLASFGFEVEVKPLLPPITAAVKVLKPSSLFAGKMHAVLFRKWKNRIKGRDFYDLLWYLGQGIPLKLSYLEAKMKDGDLLKPSESLTEVALLDLLRDRIESIDWENAKKDVATFLRDPRETAPWSRELFQAAVGKLRVEGGGGRLRGLSLLCWG